MAPKRFCACGCRGMVTAPTEARHLQLSNMLDLGQSVLNENQETLKSFSRPNQKSRKRKANNCGNSVPPSTKRQRHSENVDGVHLEDHDQGPIGEDDLQPSIDSPLPPNGNPFGPSENVEALPPASAPAGFEPSAEGDLSCLRRSARVAARMQFVAHHYHHPDLRNLAPDEPEDDGSDEEDPEDIPADDGWAEEEDTSLPAACGEEGVSVWDLLGEGFLKEVSMLDGKVLDECDVRLLKAYTLKVNDGLTDATYERLKYLVPEAGITTLEKTESRIQFLSGFKPVRYDCCPRSCICYTGAYEKLKKCPFCKVDRYKANGKARAYFEYLPVAPRLRAMASNPNYAKKMEYRRNHTPNPENISDIFDGTHYCELLTKPVMVAEQTLPFCHFSDDRDIALGLSTDGFAPFKRRTKTAWPLVLFNYNLSPEERFSKHNIISAGVIPGPKKPVDLDSFLWPLVHELIQLSIGVSAFDALSKALFILRAFLIIVFGDIPAVSMVMRVKGQNGYSPCRLCEIKGIRVPNGDAKATLYVPLHRHEFPDAPTSYDARNLPDRSHATFMAQAHEVQDAATKTKSEELATEYGIKGVPLLSCLSSISFPASFPYDFMHLIWANLIRNLIALWTGKFKDLNHQNQGYKLEKKVWDKIGKDTADAGSYIPSSFGTRVHNVAAEKSHFTCEMYSNWTLHIASAVLRGRFPQDRYYKHFLQLINLLKLCLEYEFSQDKIARLGEGFATWVEDYERLYYQHDPTRVSCCPLTLHALLHIASSVRTVGPVWAYWAFPMERHCGDIADHIGSRRYPYTSINRYVTSQAHLAQIKLLYNLQKELSLESTPSQKDHFSCPGYKQFVLSPPVSKQTTMSKALWLKLTAALATRFEVGAQVVRRLLPASTLVATYGRVLRIGGGDKMQARDLVKMAEDGRDTSYVRYRLSVDKFAHIPRREPVLEWREHFGQLLQVIVVDVPEPRQPNSKIKPRAYIFAVIRNIDAVTESLGPASISYLMGDDAGRIEVVDINRVKCVIGRIRLGERWAIVDRHDKLYPIHER